MTTKRIAYFTEAALPTNDELSDIAKLNAAAVPGYIVLIMNGSQNATYGEPDRLVPVDFVAGTIPEIYEEIDEIDPDNIPVQNLTSTQAVVNNGQKIAGVTGSGTYANIAVNPTTKAVTVTLTSS